jgi:ADP-dependent NAD(P)H-hydrate dehydratase / NAD(P)H-hydrate epimerase
VNLIWICHAVSANKETCIATGKSGNWGMTFSVKIDAQHIIQRPVLKVPATDTHKYLRGHCVVVSGPRFRTGAARLSASAALAVGAGLVTLVGDEAALCEHAAHVTAIMLRERDDTWSAIDNRVRAIAIGPGLDASATSRKAVLQLLAKDIPMVLDAGALTAFERHNDQLFEAVSNQVVFTPHEGEFSRLFPGIPLEDRIKAAQAAALVSGAVIILKGPHSIIASPSGNYAVNTHSSPWLATAGSGDVLTGLVCGLLAQGMDAFDGACAATWLHGDIGVRGGAGLTADSMIDIIPLVLKGCLQQS